MKKWLSILAAGALTAVALAGCASDDGQETADQGATLDFHGTTVTGQVSSVSGDEITLTLGALSAGGMGGGMDGGETPDRDLAELPGEPEDDPAAAAGLGLSNSDGAQDGDGPEGESDDGELTQGDAPDMDPPEGEIPDMDFGDGETPDMDFGGGFGGSMFIAGETTATLTIHDEALILTETDDGNEMAALSDIGEGAVLEITFDSAGAITAVTILSLEDS